ELSAAFVAAVCDDALLTNCVREAMRLDPEITELDRVVARDCELEMESGETLRLKAGCFLAVDAIAMQRDPDIWGPSAARFEPSRWLQADESQRRCFLSFGAGYVCLDVPSRMVL